MALAMNVMTRSVITVNLDQHLKSIYELMKQNDIRHIPVVEDKRLMGIVSQSDIFSRSTLCDGTLEIPKIKAKDVMTKKVITCTPHTRLSDIAGTFISCHISCMPVLHGESIVGIVTTSDLLDQFCIEEELGGHRVMPLSFATRREKIGDVSEVSKKTGVRGKQRQ